MALAIPFAFAAASGNTASSQLDSDFNTVRDWINNRNPTSGLLSARPAAAFAGALYFATDTNRVFLDTGTTWILVGAKDPFLVASDAEATSISATVGTTLKQLTGLSIPTTSTLLVVLAFRKSAGAADSMTLGCSLNAGATAASSVVTSAANAADSGVATILVGPRSANYLFQLIMTYSSSSVVPAMTGAGATPNAAITSIEIKGWNSGGVITVAVANVKVYELQGV